MPNQEIPWIIYAESTPNPASMKFVANRLLVTSAATVEFTDPKETTNSPLAAALFNFPFVNGIFMAGNFVTVSKNNIVDWDDILFEVRQFITEYLNAGKQIFQEQPQQTQHANSQDATQFIGLDSKPQNAKEEQIINLLEEYVRPAVEGDGGAIHFKSFNEGILTVTLRGSCSGCPSSMITLKAGIQGLFQRMMPEVKEVVAEEL